MFVSVVPVPGVGKYLKSGIRSLEGIYGGIRGSKPACGHIFLAFHPAVVLEILGVEDRQAVVDIALEAAGEREVWDSHELRPLLRTHVHLGGRRGGHTMEGLLHFPS